MSATFLTTASGRQVDLLDPQPEDIDFSDIAEQLAKECRFNGATPGKFYSVAEHSVRGARAIMAAWSNPTRPSALLGPPSPHRDGVFPVSAPDDGRTGQQPGSGGGGMDDARRALAAAYFLAHDFHEAYLKDDTTPKKRALAAVAQAEFGVLAGEVLSAFDRLTEKFDAAIHAAAGLAWPMPADIAAIVKRVDAIMLKSEWLSHRPQHDLPPACADVPIFAIARHAPWDWQFAQLELQRAMRQLLPVFARADEEEE